MFINKHIICLPQTLHLTQLFFNVGLPSVQLSKR